MRLITIAYLRFYFELKGVMLNFDNQLLRRFLLYQKTPEKEASRSCNYGRVLTALPNYNLIYDAKEENI
ncbi:MAG: hypothetical protein ACI87N_000602 [Flavobacteriales bacterium]|jgi:hypothetical protein